MARKQATAKVAKASKHNRWQCHESSSYYASTAVLCPAVACTRYFLLTLASFFMSRSSLSITCLRLVQQRPQCKHHLLHSPSPAPALLVLKDQHFHSLIFQAVLQPAGEPDMHPQVLCLQIPKNRGNDWPSFVAAPGLGRCYQDAVDMPNAAHYVET